MKKYKWVIILVNFIIVLVLFNRSVIKKETTLSEGKLVLLELTPVDPRSLMQGDYMRLRYRIVTNANQEGISRRGFCVVNLDNQGIVNWVRYQDAKSPLDDQEFLIKYTSQERAVSIGAESFFFQEGEGEKFEEAKYGGLRVDETGNSILVGLYDEDFKLIE